MKIQSNAQEDIRYEYWDVPVRDSRIYLLTVLHDLRYVHFFFLCRFGDWRNDQQELYELTIPSGDSYKITEENQGWKTNQYFFDGKGPKVGEHQEGRTLKVWNTPYAKDTYCSGLIVAENNPNPDHIFEYAIICQDQWIEFFTRSEPKWTHLKKGTKIADLIAGYLKEWGPDEE